MPWRGLFIVVVCMLAGVLSGNLVHKNLPTLKAFFLGDSALYRSSDAVLLDQFNGSEVRQLDWQSLLPEQERSVLEKYQKPLPETDITQQIMRSLQASNDEGYRSALYSVNTVDNFDGNAVSIPGFVVPVEFHADKSARLVFLVPYYGACIHFPPPPPNQIIFARLEEGLDNIDLMQAYQFDGILRQGMFEDPLGTSAYELEVVAIRPYSGEPDDFRSH